MEKLFVQSIENSFSTFAYKITITNLIQKNSGHFNENLSWGKMNKSNKNIQTKILFNGNKKTLICNSIKLVLTKKTN